MCVCFLTFLLEASKTLSFLICKGLSPIFLLCVVFVCMGSVNVLFLSLQGNGC